jgi:WD40 repeat protein
MEISAIAVSNSGSLIATG